jgi:dTDP-4-amino-4,6-dideoxygalactose transaminase
VNFAAALNSCTAALHLSLLVAGVVPGDEVITTPLTFCSTVNVIIHVGAIPVLADIDPFSMNIRPEEIQKKITSKTKAIIIVHFSGRPCNMDDILEIANKYNLKIIEDCAHAIESEYKGKKSGTFGDFGCFSFYVNKNIVTGEGGMVIAKNMEDIEKIKILSLHGMSRDAWKRFGGEGYKHYHVIEAGYKYNMMDIQAALGIHQLARIDKMWQRRREIWNCYNEAFKDLPIILPGLPEKNIVHAYHLYTILINKEMCGIERDNFLDLMTKNNVGTGVHYLSIPEHHFYREKYGWKPIDYPNAMKIGRTTVSIPLSAKLTDGEVEKVVDAVRGILS